MASPKRKHELPRNWIAPNEVQPRLRKSMKSVHDLATFHSDQHEPSVEDFKPDKHESLAPLEEHKPGKPPPGKSRRKPSALSKELEKRASGRDGLADGVEPHGPSPRLSRRSAMPSATATLHGAHLLRDPPPSDGGLPPAAAAKKAAVLKHLGALEKWRRRSGVSARGRRVIELEQEKVAREGQAAVMRLHYGLHPAASRRFDIATEEQQRRMLGAEGGGPAGTPALHGMANGAKENVRPVRGLLAEQFPLLAG